MTAAAVLCLLRDRGWSVATCESLSGGLLVAALIDPAGASTVVRGGLVTYATDLKSSLAGVDAAVVARDGVVSEAVALAMADGARRTCGADVGVATTGVAGPDPVGTTEVGTVWLAVVTPEGRWARGLRLTGGRGEVRRASVGGALALLLDVLRGTAPRNPGPDASACR